MKSHGGVTKWYVKNGPLEWLVVARTPIDACVEAIAAMGRSKGREYRDTTEIPMELMPYDCFTIDQFGFRKLEGNVIPRVEADEFPCHTFAMYIIDRGEVLDWYDEKLGNLDPFCEFDSDQRRDEFFEELGGEA